MPFDSESVVALKEELLKSDNEFRTLYEEHQDCERRLEELESRALSFEDESEAKRIKLHKLVLKDRMYQMLRAHQESAAAVA